MNNSAYVFVITIILTIAVFYLIRKPLKSKRRSNSFQSKPRYGTIVQTLGGETVKSLGEKQIADYFYSNGISYRYEYHAETRWLRRHISNPDFYLPDYKLYVEFWGMLYVDDAQTRSNYEITRNLKMRRYFQNDIKFMSLYESDLPNLDLNFKSKLSKLTGIEFTPS